MGIMQFKKVGIKTKMKTAKQKQMINGINVDMYYETCTTHYIVGTTQNSSC